MGDAFVVCRPGLNSFESDIIVKGGGGGSGGCQEFDIFNHRLLYKPENFMDEIYRQYIDGGKQLLEKYLGNLSRRCLMYRQDKLI